MKLSAKKRLELIDRELHEKGQVFSRDLAERCETSMETIRKDLEMLEASGVAVKVYGGALLAQTGAERLVSMRVQGQEQKQKIGRLAARLLEGAHSVILDSGTTVLAAVPYINRMPAMNIMTCSLDAFEALDGSHHQVFLTGGKKREKNRSLVGFGAQESIQRFHGDICLMGTAGLKDMAGRTEADDVPAVRSGDRAGGFSKVPGKRAAPVGKLGGCGYAGDRTGDQSGSCIQSGEAGSDHSESGGSEGKLKRADISCCMAAIPALFCAQISETLLDFIRAASSRHSSRGCPFISSATSTMPQRSDVRNSVDSTIR